MKTSTKILLALWIPILTVIVVSFGYCSIGSIKDMNNPDSWKQISHNHEAYSMAQEFIKKELKYPETAIFSEYDSNKIIYESEEHIYKIKGSLESKNALGLLVPMNYYVKIQQISENNWTLLDISLE